jgi:hypothetical protein
VGKPDGDKWAESRLNRRGEEIQPIQSQPAARRVIPIR